MHKEILTINGKKLNYKSYKSVINKEGKKLKVENLAGVNHIVKYDLTQSAALGSFNRVTVPEDHYLVLGDNRRNSADSRVHGFVPREEIKGKANYVAFSLNYDNYFLPKTDRFLESLYTL
jgi:signal peptidase I